MKKIAIIATLVLLGSACSTTQTQTAQEMAKTPAESAKAIAAAEAARSKAAAVGYEWRDTGKLIDAAKKAQAAKDNAKAVKLAKQAQRQAENALKQSQQ